MMRHLITPEMVSAKARRRRQRARAAERRAVRTFSRAPSDQERRVGVRGTAREYEHLAYVLGARFVWVTSPQPGVVRVHVERGNIAEILMALCDVVPLGVELGVCRGSP